MQHIRRICGLVLIAILVLSGFAGCRGSSDSPPVMPQMESPEMTAANAPTATESESIQWGTWILRFREADGEEPANVEAIPYRIGLAHMDVMDMLKPPFCSNCMDIDLLGVIEQDWTVYVELTNPTILSGYDVMGIFPGTNCPTLLEPNGFTDLFDVDGEWSTHHPYVIFDTGSPNREWGPGESHGITLTFRKETDEKFADLIYVACASWPGNQEEVAELRNPEASGPLHTDASDPIDFSVEVVDWQDNVDYVLIDLSPVNGNAYTHMHETDDGVWKYESYAAYGLTPGTRELLIAAKSENSSNLTYTYLTVDIIDPPPPPSYFDTSSGPTLLESAGAPEGPMDLAVVGLPGGASFTLVNSSSTTIHMWNADYTLYDLFLTLIDTTGEDPNFPIEPICRIAATDPVEPSFPAKYSLLQSNLDTDVFDPTTDPQLLYRNSLQLLDLEGEMVFDFRLTADNEATDELDAILRPADISCGTNGNKYGYAIWGPDAGFYPAYFPYVTVVRYEPPYKNETEEFDVFIGGILDGSGAGEVSADDITGLAVYDGAGDSDIVIVVSEGGEVEEVEIFQADYLGNPASEFTSVATLTGFVGTPIDVAMIPVGDAGEEDENWFCVLTDANTIEVYTLGGDFIESIYDPDVLVDQVRYLDTDLENLRIHVSMDGPQMAVFQYTGL